MPIKVANARSRPGTLVLPCGESASWPHLLLGREPGLAGIHPWRAREHTCAQKVSFELRDGAYFFPSVSFLAVCGHGVGSVNLMGILHLKANRRTHLQTFMAAPWSSHWHSPSISCHALGAVPGLWCPLFLTDMSTVAQSCPGPVSL